VKTAAMGTGFQYMSLEGTFQIETIGVTKITVKLVFIFTYTVTFTGVHYFLWLLIPVLCFYLSLKESL
jgi:hypothetical protein